MLFEKLFRIIKSNMVSNETKVPPSAHQQQYHSSGQQHSAGQKKQQTTSSANDLKEKAYYEALEITPPAGFEEIKASYKKLVRKYHPDLFHNSPQKRQYAEVVTQKINEAYAYFEQKYEK